MILSKLVNNSISLNLVRDFVSDKYFFRFFDMIFYMHELQQYSAFIH